MESQKIDYPDGIEECGTDALRLTLLQYLGQVSQHSARLLTVYCPSACQRWKMRPAV